MYFASFSMRFGNRMRQVSTQESRDTVSKRRAHGRTPSALRDTTTFQSTPADSLRFSAGSLLTASCVKGGRGETGGGGGGVGGDADKKGGGGGGVGRGGVYVQQYVELGGEKRPKARPRGHVGETSEEALLRLAIASPRDKYYSSAEQTAAIAAAAEVLPRTS
jgi:hypothetical protein